MQPNYPNEAPFQLRLHHVGVLVKNIEKATERYVRSFGYTPRTETIHDLIQTAYVRFLCLPGEQTYLELVSPDGPASVLQNALKKHGGIHHICYSTTNIDSFIERLRETGCMIISEPKPAVAFNGRRIAWVMTQDYSLSELVEQGPEGEL